MCLKTYLRSSKKCGKKTLALKASLKAVFSVARWRVVIPTNSTQCVRIFIMWCRLCHSTQRLGWAQWTTLWWCNRCTNRILLAWTMRASLEPIQDNFLIKTSKSSQVIQRSSHNKSVEKQIMMVWAVMKVKVKTLKKTQTQKFLNSKAKLSKQMKTRKKIKLAIIIRITHPTIMVILRLISI